MAVVHNAELLNVIVDGGESAKSLQRPGMEQLLAMVDAKKVHLVRAIRFCLLFLGAPDFLVALAFFVGLRLPFR